MIKNYWEPRSASAAKVNATALVHLNFIPLYAAPHKMRALNSLLYIPHETNTSSLTTLMLRDRHTGVLCTILSAFLYT